MKNNVNKKMMKKLLVVVLLVLSLSSVSAFCASRGYILDSENEAINATKVNIVCKRSSGEIISQDAGKIGYFFPFGDWYDDCSYCDLGIYVSAVVDDSNFFGEFYNETCNQEIKICHTNIYMNQISEPVSETDYYDASPDVGPLVETVPKTMPKSNESPQTKVPGIKPVPVDYTYLYVLGAIVFLIIFILIINAFRKYGK